MRRTQKKVKRKIKRKTKLVKRKTKLVKRKTKLVKRKTKLVKRKQKVSRKRLTKNRQHRGGGYAETGHAGDRDLVDPSRGESREVPSNIFRRGDEPVSLEAVAEKKLLREQAKPRKKEGDPCPSADAKDAEGRPLRLDDGALCKERHTDIMGKGCNEYAYKVDDGSDQYAFCRNPSSWDVPNVLLRGRPCRLVGAYRSKKKLCIEADPALAPTADTAAPTAAPADTAGV